MTDESRLALIFIWHDVVDVPHKCHVPSASVTNEEEAGPSERRSTAHALGPLVGGVQLRFYSSILDLQAQAAAPSALESHTN